MHASLICVFAFALVTYVLAFLVTTILHELAHALASLALGGRPVLHHVYVAHQNLQGAKQAWVSGAGPLVSLVQGGVLLAILGHGSGIPSAFRLALTWLCIHGLVNFFGYLVTTPLVRSGDLGKVADWLRVPAVGRWALFCVGLAAITWIGGWAREPLLSFAVEPVMGMDAAARTRHLLAIGVGPWLVGGILIALASWPSPHWLSFAYPFFAGFFLIPTIRGASGPVPPHLGGERWLEASLWPWVFALAAVVAIFRVLVRGVRLSA